MDDALWLDHFGRLEFGEVVPAAPFLAAPKAASGEQSEVDFNVATLPSPAEIEKALRSMKCYKSAGLGLIPGEALKQAPGRIKAAVFPLVLKAATGLQQHVQ